MATKNASGSSTAGDGSFPGGRTKLPRLSHPDTDETDVVFVESAFFKEPPAPRRGNRRAEPSSLTGTGFGLYYSTQSLFEPTPPRSTDDTPGVEIGTGPYAVLGVSRHASWEEIRRAHRKLVSELHPDRFVDADDEVREYVETKIRDVNEAFSEIRRSRGGPRP